MKNIIPFKKDVIFKTNLTEITSISLEHTLILDNNNISGEFIINGDYKIAESSTTTEPFDIKIPFDIAIDERYNTDKAVVDIYDFYYEIVNDNVLSISIDVLVDKMEERLIEEDVLEDKSMELERQEEILDQSLNEILDKEEEDKVIEETYKLEEETRNEDIDITEKIDSLFDNLSSEEVFVSYSVCIIREGDNLESIIEKYGVTEELLRKYNSLTDLKIGDKLIIPSVNEES